MKTALISIQTYLYDGMTKFLQRILMGNSSSAKNENAASEGTEKKEEVDGNNEVNLVVSEMGGQMGFTAYHSSLQINGTEYFFDMGGVVTSKSLRSHDAREGAPR